MFVWCLRGRRVLHGFRGVPQRWRHTLHASGARRQRLRWRLLRTQTRSSCALVRHWHADDFTYAVRRGGTVSASCRGAWCAPRRPTQEGRRRGRHRRGGRHLGRQRRGGRETCRGSDRRRSACSRRRFLTARPATKQALARLTRNPRRHHIHWDYFGEPRGRGGPEASAIRSPVGGWSDRVRRSPDKINTRASARGLAVVDRGGR